ncbi:MAG TPA: CoA transferase [Candidatus Eremiobacteraceae bacterium]|jgi:crotonobetainyl-CoA:carnitine CoA-transferase CaiB-like acyl-CoA transferase|nr:CoA transferase [Candidatus Eremiobacteraceae bacterium]
MTGGLAALAGIRVLDFSHALAGPYCTMLLSDYGAEVYKLEARSGDMGRGWGPPFAGGVASFFLGLNRGKLGISLDLKQPEGLELCLRMIDHVDVLIENFRPGAMDKLGLGYEEVRKRNPRLIYCSISGYGQRGPSRDEAAMDMVMQASSGLLSITGTEEGESVRCGYGVTDVTAGLFAVIGILLALRARETTGRGQFVDVSMLDSMISTMSSNYMSYLGSRIVPKPMGTSFPTIVPYRVYQASDREVAIAVGSERLWAIFCSAIERPDLEKHPDYHTNALRIENREKLEPILDHVFSGRSGSAWVERLQSAGVPSSLLRNFGEVAEHPQSEIREMFPVLDHLTAGAHKVTGTPVKLSETAGHPNLPAPLLGQHTRTVLKDLFDLSDARFDDLVARGIVFESH